MKKLLLTLLLIGDSANAQEGFSLSIPVTSEAVEERSPICYEEYRKVFLWGDSRLRINNVSWDRIPHDWDRATSLVSGEIYLDGRAITRMLFAPPHPVLERICE